MNKRMNTKGKRVVEGNWEIAIDTYILLMKKVGKKIVKALVAQSHLIETPWTVACQAPPSMGFSRQEY